MKLAMPHIDYAKLSEHNEEAFQEMLADLREARRLRETFGPPKPLIDPKYLPSLERKKDLEDEDYSRQLDSMGYSQ